MKSISWLARLRAVVAGAFVGVLVLFAAAVLEFFLLAVWVAGSAPRASQASTAGGGAVTWDVMSVFYRAGLRGKAFELLLVLLPLLFSALAGKSMYSRTLSE
ncbi:MAG TPA: hypothetical protein VFI82_11140 [Terriglobales bacterium]|nr:hypothetical protein [Terriglobales bacterium]